MRIMKTVGTLVSVILLPTVLHVGLARSADTGSSMAALVMDMTWMTEPPLTIHREIAAGTQIAIRPGERLSLLHYKTCSIVAFSGGTVRGTRGGLEAADANIKSRKPGPCSR